MCGACAVIVGDSEPHFGAWGGNPHSGALQKTLPTHTLGFRHMSEVCLKQSRVCMYEEGEGLEPLHSTNVSLPACLSPAPRTDRSCVHRILVFPLRLQPQFEGL